MENGAYEKIVSHLEKELELNGSEVADELQMNFVTEHLTKLKPGKRMLTCHHCQKPNQYRNQCCQRKKERDQGAGNKKNAVVNDNRGRTMFDPNSNDNVNRSYNNNTKIEMEEN